MAGGPPTKRSTTSTHAELRSRPRGGLAAGGVTDEKVNKSKKIIIIIAAPKFP